jgi:ketosteroid isomerase-like protein
MARLRQRSTNRIIQLLVAHFMRLRDGRIIEMREFMDSFDAVQQVLGHEIDMTKL